MSQKLKKQTSNDLSDDESVEKSEANRPFLKQNFNDDPVIIISNHHHLEENLFKKNAPDDPAEFEDAVSSTGFGWYNIILLIVCGLSLMSVIIETMNMSYVVPAAQCDLNLTIFDKTILLSVGFMGLSSVLIFINNRRTQRSSSSEKSIQMTYTVNKQNIEISYWINLLLDVKFEDTVIIARLININSRLIKEAIEISRKVGVVLSSLLWGFIGDTTGRRKVVMITSFLSFTAGVISSISTYVEMLIVLRFINCFLIGGPSGVVIAYLGEFHGIQHRARIIALSATFVAVGSVLMPSLAWIILPMTWQVLIPGLEIMYRPWRLLIIIYGLPSFISAVCLIFLPESPKYLWAAGRSEEALVILRKIYVYNTGNPENSFPVTKLVESNENIGNDNEDKPNIKSTNLILYFFKLLKKQITPIFRPPLLIRTLLTSFLCFGVFASSPGILMWLPAILNKVSYYIEVTNDSTVTICQAIDFKENVTNILPLNNNNTITYDMENSIACSDSIDTQVYIISIIVGIVFAFTYMFIGTVINYTGKKKLLAGLLLVTGIAGIITNFVTSYILIAIMSGLFILGGAGVTILNTAVVDMFPTQYRSIAMSISLMAGRTGAVAASQVIGYLLEYTCLSVFFLLGGLNILLAGVSLLLPST